MRNRKNVLCCPDPSKNRSIGAQARVTACQIRNNVDLCCYTETDQYGRDARRPDSVAQAEKCNPDRDRGEKQCRDTRRQKLIQQVTTAYAPHEQPNAEERTGERRQLSRAATVGQDRRSVFRQVSFAHQWWFPVCRPLGT